MKQLVCYLTAALPCASFTEELALAMSENGVDALELGIPFSDPVADGEVIAKANIQVLQQGFAFGDVAKIAHNVHTHMRLFVMSYANPLYHNDLDSVFSSFAQSGISGVIIPDVPFEESTPYKQAATRHHLSFVPLVAPTTQPERVKRLVESVDCRAFIYLVAYTGITGAAKNEDLQPLIASIRKSSSAPVFVGFGVNAHNARQKAEGADGVIVGSAIVQILLQDSSGSEKIRNICALCKSIKDAINS